MKSNPEQPEEELERSQGLFMGALGAALAFVLVVMVGGATLGIGLAPSEAEREARAASRSRDIQPGDDARIFAQRCASCHGAGGQGLIGPSFGGVSDRMTVEEQEAVVKAGRNNMPSFAAVLSDEQIAAVVKFEREVLDEG